MDEHNDVAPTFSEICAHLNIGSKSTVHRFLARVEQRGYIRRLPNRNRAIELIKRPEPREDPEIAATRTRAVVSIGLALERMGSAGSEADKAALPPLMIRILPEFSSGMHSDRNPRTHAHPIPPPPSLLILTTSFHIISLP